MPFQGDWSLFEQRIGFPAIGCTAIDWCMAIPDYQSLMLPVLKIAVEGETRVPLAAAEA
jgi:hypothetical protein